MKKHNTLGLDGAKSASIASFGKNPKKKQSVNRKQGSPSKQMLIEGFKTGNLAKSMVIMNDQHRNFTKREKSILASSSSGDQEQKQYDWNIEQDLDNVFIDDENSD